MLYFHIHTYIIYVNKYHAFAYILTYIHAGYGDVEGHERARQGIVAAGQLHYLRKICSISIQQKILYTI